MTQQRMLEIFTKPVESRAWVIWSPLQTPSTTANGLEPSQQEKFHSPVDIELNKGSVVAEWEKSSKLGTHN